MRVIYHHEADGWWAESPDLDGFVAGGPTLAEAREQVSEGLPFYLERDDVALDERFPADVRLVSLTVSTASAGMALSAGAEMTTAGPTVTAATTAPRHEPISLEAKVAEAAPRVTSTEEAWLQPA